MNYIDGYEVLNELNTKWHAPNPKLAKLQFSKWCPWMHRHGITNIDKIGVYILARFEGSEQAPNDTDSLDKHVVYIGRTNIGRATSLKRRLRYFNKEAFGGSAAHSGASNYKDYFGTNQDGLYVSVCPIFWLDDRINNLTRNKDNFNAWISGTSPQAEPFFIYLITKWLEVCLRGLYVYKWGSLPICNKE